MTTPQAAAPVAASPRLGRRCFYGDETMQPRGIRMTDEQYAKLSRLGGGQWVRDAIDRAEEPAK